MLAIVPVVCQHLVIRSHALVTSHASTNQLASKRYCGKSAWIALTEQRRARHTTGYCARNNYTSSLLTAQWQVHLSEGQAALRLLPQVRLGFHLDQPLQLHLR